MRSELPESELPVKKTARTPAAAIALTGAGVIGWSLSFLIDAGTRRLLPAGLAVTGAVGAWTARKMGRALRTPDGRGPIHLAAVTATAWWTSTVIPVAWIALMPSGVHPLVRVVAGGYSLVFVALGVGFVCFVRVVRRHRSTPRSHRLGQHGSPGQHLAGVPEGIIVCGAGLIQGRVSRVLAYRVDKGIEVWREIERVHPSESSRDEGPEHEPVLVLCGGRGNDEPRPEAEAMAEYAREQGMQPQHIVVEDTSTTTEENLRQAHAIMTERLGREPQSLVVVSTDFHCIRIDMIVERLRRAELFRECDVEVVGATNPRSVQNHSLLREYAAVGMYYVKNLFR